MNPDDDLTGSQVGELTGADTGAVTASPSTGTDAGTSNYGAAGGAGIGLQVGGTIGKGLAAFYAGKANQAIDNFNARVEQYKAQAAINRGIFQANQIGRQGAQIIGAQRTAEAANGVVISSGTNATVQAQQQGVTSADMAQARNNALMQAWGLNSDAASATMRGKLAATGGRQAAAGSVLSAAGLASSDFYRLNN